MKLTPLEATEAEWLQKLTLLPNQLLRDELTNSDHFVTVIRVGDDVYVLAKNVEDRKIIGGEAPKPAGLLFVFVC